MRPRPSVSKQCDHHLSLGLFVSRAGAQSAFLPPKMFVLKVRLAHRTRWHSGDLDQEGLHRTLPNQLQVRVVVSFVARRKIGETGALTASER